MQVSCLTCRKVSANFRGFSCHLTLAHTDYYANNKKEAEEAEKIYNSTPLICICGAIKVFSKRKNKYCSSSCGASNSNKQRTKESREKLGKKLSISMRNKFWSNIEKRFKHKRKLDEFAEGAEYTRIYLCTCKYSGKQWYSKTAKTIHPDLARSKQEYAYSCAFKFGISSFPLWFTDASELINLHGWYCTPGSNKKGKTNVDGISRDHLYSTRDGWINNISPSIMRHPANCRLIQHKQNQSKNKNSIITLEELHEKIKEFENLYPDYKHL